MLRRDRRFQRQFEVLERMFPPLRRPIAALRRDGWRMLRLPLAFILIIGGLFSFLPVLGVWMLPVGLLLLAVDLPVLRGPISALVIRSRRWISRLRRRTRR